LAKATGELVFIVALLVTAAAVLRFMYAAPAPRFHNYGIVHTPLGLAAVACGGETSECGKETAIRFESCSPQWRDYFSAVAKRTSLDHLARELIGKRPPSGDEWSVQCGGADGMIQGQPLAKLEAN